MAEVFLASSVGAEGFSRKVAIKRVLPGFSDNPQFAKMFIDEARISSRLVHPNIVSVVDFDRDPEGRLYLVMELVEGRDLDGLGSTGPLPVPVIIFVISEVLRGLGHAHDLPVVEDEMLQGSHTIRTMRGIVHRDVSPHNVLLSWEGAVKVSDFGIAKARSASSATASEFIKGKPAYMSPEQANGENLDGRSDLFAVGVIMWELLVGRRLFVGQDTRTTLAAVLFGQIPRPRSMRSDIGKDVEKVVMKLLERDLPARYANAEAAIADLLECKDAPRDGRELLKKTLAERFPQLAPIRHSVLRSRGGSPPVGTPQQGYPTQPGYGQDFPQQPLPPHLQPTHQPTHAQVTIADGQVGRPYGALPSMGHARGAQTSTLPPGPGAYVGPAAQPLPRRRNKGRLAIVIASMVAAGAVVFAVAMAMRGDPKSQIVAQGSGSASTGSASAAAPPPPVVDAAVTAPVDAAGPDAPMMTTAPPVDAGVADAKKDAIAVRPGEKRMGRLVVKTFPIVTVYVDNRKISDTPVDMPLTVGKHKLQLVNSEGNNESLTVTIEPNKTTKIERN